MSMFSGCWDEAVAAYTTNDDHCAVFGICFFAER